MSFGPILFGAVLLLLVAVLPAWPHARGWGYRPSITLGVLLTFIVLLIAVRII